MWRSVAGCPTEFDDKDRVRVGGASPFAHGDASAVHGGERPWRRCLVVGGDHIEHPAEREREEDRHDRQRGQGCFAHGVHEERGDGQCPDQQYKDEVVGVVAIPRVRLDHIRHDEEEPDRQQANGHPFRHGIAHDLGSGKERKEEPEIASPENDPVAGQDPPHAHKGKWGAKGEQVKERNDAYENAAEQEWPIALEAVAGICRGIDAVVPGRIQPGEHQQHDREANHGWTLGEEVADDWVLEPPAAVLGFRRSGVGAGQAVEDFETAIAEVTKEIDETPAAEEHEQRRAEQGRGLSAEYPHANAVHHARKGKQRERTRDLQGAGQRRSSGDQQGSEIVDASVIANVVAGRERQI
ncbi:hypothetical protein GQR58_029572 [Nymphon striatum]|nr:hypothetical protein GQR58_029572 [Nymphon striatum]